METITKKWKVRLNAKDKRNIEPKRLVDRVDDYLAGICDKVEAILKGLAHVPSERRSQILLAYQEAVANANWHGNFEISSEEKDSGVRREPTAVQVKRSIEIILEITEADTRLVVADEGDGFTEDPNYDPFDPVNIEKPHGNGLLIMRGFATVEFTEPGNKVTMIFDLIRSEAEELVGNS